ncbi:MULTISPECIES: DUF3078 domain-containing protein [Sphingobacterium]|uniref:DUF3078 domain-containing protein n=1 Tax=Sphingobacterium cellulitidis TaxID=1768011 RepID=A0A8H9KUR0_9SPHI|nr:MULTISPECIES: DUF3078 domain-containing protein [Sphingobacterium]MBA8985146.1 hypothetical protein [Sphingobacterium soli]OYD40772.1 hypothetical protein CHT99_17385 [Sphingobacterium cellulitidis]WFB63568.1 DUF3078 domain-containing protein [Sphingobacterium sp. WM]GGE11898.1 hypothetical protein GCM10011516_07090 [Sphingobacterium soli]
MNIKIYLLPVFIFIFGMSLTQAQDLRELRVRPDSAISEDTTGRALAIKNINVPIPKLDLRVNYWKHWTRLGVNFNQAAFSENWKLGGLNSFAIGGILWHKSEFNRNNFNFTSEVDLKYGKVKNEGQLAKPNNDRIFWDNKLAYKLTKSWAVYLSLTYETQFDNSFHYAMVDGEEVITGLKSSFMAPGYFTESFGLEYKPDQTFSLRFGTGTARQTLILDNRLKPLNAYDYFQKHGEYKDPNDVTKGTGPMFGVEEGKIFNNELAFQLTANLDRNLTKNLHLKARYNLFADYEDITDPTHRLDATLTAKVTSLINVALGGVVLYDTALDNKVQWNQMLSMGVLLNLPK